MECISGACMGSLIANPSIKISIFMFWHSKTTLVQVSQSTINQLMYIVSVYSIFLLLDNNTTPVVNWCIQWRTLYNVQFVKVKSNLSDTQRLHLNQPHRLYLTDKAIDISFSSPKAIHLNIRFVKTPSPSRFGMPTEMHRNTVAKCKSTGWFVDLFNSMCTNGWENFSICKIKWKKIAWKKKWMCIVKSKSKSKSKWNHHKKIINEEENFQRVGKCYCCAFTLRLR